MALFQYAEPILEEITLGGKPTGLSESFDHRWATKWNTARMCRYRSLTASSLVMTAMVYEAPVGAGGWAAFVSATGGLEDSGTTISLTKENERSDASAPFDGDAGRRAFVPDSGAQPAV